MACSSCGGRSAGGVRKGVKAQGIASRSKKLPWAHISPGKAVARYATEAEAKAAARLFGGDVEKRSN